MGRVDGRERIEIEHLAETEGGSWNIGREKEGGVERWGVNICARDADSNSQASWPGRGREGPIAIGVFLDPTQFSPSWIQSSFLSNLTQLPSFDHSIIVITQSQYSHFTSHPSCHDTISPWQFASLHPLFISLNLSIPCDVFTSFHLDWQPAISGRSPPWFLPLFART